MRVVISPPTEADEEAFTDAMRRSRRLDGRWADGPITPEEYAGVAGHEGRGLMSEAMQLVLREAFGPLRLHRVEATIQPGNLPSIALARRNGFRLEGFSPRYLKINGRWRDHERWAINAEQWREFRRGR